MQLTIQEAASLLRVPGSMVHRWIRDRGLPAIKFNEQYRLNPVDLVDWAQSHQVPIDPDELAARQPPPPPMADALALGGIHRDVPGKGRRQLLAAIVERLPLHGPGDRELLTDLLCARQHFCTTAARDGIGIPHALHPIVQPLGPPLVSLSFPQHEFSDGNEGDGTRDRKTVRALFVLVTPTIRMHLQFLARLTHALGSDSGDMSFGRRVAERASDVAILDALRAAERNAPPAAAAGASGSTP